MSLYRSPSQIPTIIHSRFEFHDPPHRHRIAFFSSPSPSLVGCASNEKLDAPAASLFRPGWRRGKDRGRAPTAAAGCGHHGFRRPIGAGAVSNTRPTTAIIPSAPKKRRSRKLFARLKGIRSSPGARTGSGASFVEARLGARRASRATRGGPLAALFHEDPRAGGGAFDS